MKSFKNILICILLLTVIGLIINGYNRKIKTNYIKGKTIHDIVISPVPYRVEVPTFPDFPIIHDTVSLPGEKEYIVQKIDTQQIIADYIKKLYYKDTLFDSDTLGSMIVDIIVQYNKMQSLEYYFTPIQKETIIEKNKLLAPFISASANTLGQLDIGIGFYYKNIGVEVKYITNFENKGIGIGISKKLWVKLNT